MNFTVEATTAPVNDGDWSLLYRVIDLVPGAMLIEDADEPMLVVPVEADEPMRAALFMDGLAKMVGLELRAGSIYPEPEADFDTDDTDDTPTGATEAVEVLSQYMHAAPEFDRRVDASGHLVNC